MPADAVILALDPAKGVSGAALLRPAGHKSALAAYASITTQAERAAFVEATLQLLDQPELRRRIGAFNRERVCRHFRWPRAARRVLDIYEEIVGDWKRGVRRA